MNRELIGSVFWGIVGFLFCVGSWPYGFGRSGFPGPGLLPFACGLLLTGLSLLLLIQTVLKNRLDPKSSRAEINLPAHPQAIRVLIVLSALFVAVIALEWLGFIITSFLFMACIIGLDYRKWPLTVLASGAFTTFFYILFKLLLKVPLPQGQLGF